MEKIPIEANDSILVSCLEKDYFTSALPWQQRGITPALPLSGYANANFNMSTNFYDNVVLDWNGYKSNMSAKFPGGTYIATNVQTPGVQPGDSTYSMQTKLTAETFKTWINNNSVNLANIATFNVSDLRLAFQVQKFLERNARAGGRYIEFLRAQYGVAPRTKDFKGRNILGVLNNL